ncbi:hypothetical protein EG328_003111 [Venturia inaequalis]|uniref:Uncharacterized protein n=1 Tax=Venturia inaequalis TaxID=5025 RepID=A0A8H3UTX4_VENIN|nr:hypothetical protein EG328_003111 [Venturia inaequalis]
MSLITVSSPSITGAAMSEPTSITASLTTIFTPPIACFTDIWEILGNLEIALVKNTSCYPPDYTEYGRYSPGICPYGYHTARAEKTRSEMRATCCPSGFQVGVEYRSCLSSFNGPSTVSSVFFQRDSFSTFTITAAVLTETRLASPETMFESYITSTTITVSDVRGIFAPWIEVRYKESDRVIVSLLAEQSPTSDPMSSNSPTSDPMSSNFPTSDPTSSNSLHHGGKIAGIVVGSLIALALALAGVWLLRRRKRTKLKHIEAERDEWAKAELEVNGCTIAEMAGEKDVVELEAPPAPPVELAGVSPAYMRQESIPGENELRDA